MDLPISEQVPLPPVRLFHLICLFLLFILLGNDALAQQPVMQHWSQAEGLPSNMVFDIAQDHHGQMWLGHDKGLSRFDGKDFITFTHPSMNGSAVSNVFEDSVGRIWCQNFIGQVFHVTDGVMMPEERIPVSGNYAPFILTPQGSIVNAFGRQIVFYDQHTLTPQQMLTTHDHIGSTQLYNGNLWVLTEQQLLEFNGQAPVRTLNVSMLSGFAAYEMGMVGDRFYAFPKRTNAGLVYQVLPEMRELKRLPSDVVVQCVRTFGDSLLWVGTTDGLFVLDRDLRPILFDQPLLKGRSVSDVLRDRDGAFWVTTTDRGIFRIPDPTVVQWSPADDPFTVFAHRDDGEGILIGTESGNVWELDGEHNRELRLLIKASARHRVVSILRSVEDNAVLVASDRLYVHRNGKQVAAKDGAVKDMLREGRDRYVMAVTGAIKRIHMASANAEWQTIEVGSAMFRSTSMEKRVQDGTGQVATSIGIRQFGLNGQPTSIALNKDVIATQILWVGDTLFASTISQGILLLDTEGNIITSIPPDSIGGTGAIGRMVLHNGLIYARTDRRIRTIDPRTLEVGRVNTSFLGTNDLLSDFIIRDGMLYVASGQRVIRAGLHTPLGPARLPELRIERLWSNDEAVSMAHEVRLPHHRNSIRLDYTVPWFGDLNALEVRYRVNGGEWRSNDPMSRMLNLPYLSPGDYEVELQAVLPDGRRTTTTAVSLRIIAPVYARWWFIALCLVLFAVGVYTLYRYRLRFIEGQNILIQEKLKLEKELDRSMLASIRSQMNPHFIFNALNTIQSYIYLNDKPNAISYLGKFSSLTRLILEMSNHEKVCLRDEVEALKLYLELEKMRFEESLDIEIDIEPAIKAEQCFIPTMLIQPYLENAVKHGLLHKKENRSVRILFRLKPNDMLEVTIEDNGIGRKRSAELNAKSSRHRPFSTEANQKRLEIMNKAIPEGFTVTYIDRVDAQGRAEGTTVILMMPLK